MPVDNPPALPEKHPRIHRILIADDEYENRYLLQIMLEGSGYQVITVENGQEALEILKNEKVDAVISDILMPLVDGFQLCRIIKGNPELAHISFIFYSASYIEKKDRDFGLSLGADEYITKPIEPEDFLTIISKVLKKVERGELDSEGKTPPDNLSYFTEYAGVLGRKLDQKVVEVEEHREAARFSEEKYQDFLQNLQGIGYLIQSDEEIPVIFEGQVQEITGYSATDFLSGKLKWKNILYPDDKEQYLQEVEKIGLSTGNKFSYQYRIIHSTGDIRWVHEIASCLFSRQPGVSMAQGAIYDITVQKLAEEKILISEERYRNLFDTMAEGVVYQDRNGYVIDANPSAEQILGLTLDEMQGRTSTDPRWKSIHEDGSPFPGEDHPAMVALRTGRKNSQVMGVYNPRDDRTRWIVVNAVPRFLPGEDTPYQVYTTFEDITLEREARDHIGHLNRILKAIRAVNILITGETNRETLLTSICSSLARGEGYSGVWIILESEPDKQIFQAISDSAIRNSLFYQDISRGNIDSWIDAGNNNPVIAQSIQIINDDGIIQSDNKRYGVMITRISFEDVEYGTMCACAGDTYVYDPQEHSLFLEIARDIGFALHHMSVQQSEEITRIALRASEKQFRELVENISETLFTVNRDGVFTYISPAISELSALSPSQLIGHHYHDYIVVDDRTMVDGWFENILNNYSAPVEFRIVNGHNQVRSLRVKANPVFIRGEFVEVTGVISDITVWKESEIIKSERSKEIQTLLSLHLLTNETENEIFTFALHAALDISQSEVGFIGFMNEEGSNLDIQIWSPEVMKSCSIHGSIKFNVTSSSGLWSECIRMKKPVIVNDYQLRSDRHGYPEGHVPILRFLEVPVMDGDNVTAVIAVANRIEPYTDANAKALNTLGNTLWEIIRLKRSDQEIKKALTQIAQNMEQMATLNDTIRNPLSVIAMISDLVDDQYKPKIMEAVRNIDLMINRLDQGWIQSEKVKNFLIKHYRFNKENF